MANKNGSTVTETPATVPPSSKVSKEDLRKLFSAYDHAQAELETLQAKIDAAKAKRSNAVAAICKGAGAKGPFKHPANGLVMSAVERVNKETNESHWFFKTPGGTDLIEV